MYVQFIDTKNPLWMEILHQLPHDFYHLPEYLELEARRTHSRAKAILIQDKGNVFFLPYLLREWYSDKTELKGLDVVSPYGYPGFLVSETASRSNFINQSIVWLQEAWKSQEICSAFLRLHPIFNYGIEQDLLDHSSLHPSGRTVAIDLTSSLDDLWKQTRENHRRGIKRLKQKGFSVKMVPIEANLDTFIAIYEETMDRVSAKPFYYFSQDYFIQLIRILNSKLHLCVAQLDQTVVAAALITECNGIVQYHLGGTLNSFLNEAPTKLIFDYVRTWAKERGNKIFHLGGGLGAAQDSLYNFKLGFANRIYCFSTLRLVVDETQYSSWVKLKAEKTHQSPEQLIGTNFFPAYRAII